MTVIVEYDSSGKSRAKAGEIGAEIMLGGTAAFGVEVTLNNAAAAGTVSFNLMSAVSAFSAGIPLTAGGEISLAQKFGGLSAEVSGSLQTSGKSRGACYYL
jgi:hypothetical protein